MAWAEAPSHAALRRVLGEDGVARFDKLVAGIAALHGGGAALRYFTGGMVSYRGPRAARLGGCASYSDVIITRLGRISKREASHCYCRLGCSRSSCCRRRSGAWFRDHSFSKLEMGFFHEPPDRSMVLGSGTTRSE